MDFVNNCQRGPQLCTTIHPQANPWPAQCPHVRLTNRASLRCGLQHHQPLGRRSLPPLYFAWALVGFARLPRRSSLHHPVQPSPAWNDNLDSSFTTPRLSFNKSTIKCSATSTHICPYLHYRSPRLSSKTPPKALLSPRRPSRNQEQPRT